MQTFYRAAASRKAVKVSLNSDLLRLGRGMGLDVSALAEEALAKAVRARHGQSWLEENAEAIQAFNEHAEATGVYSDGLRRF